MTASARIREYLGRYPLGFVIVISLVIRLFPVPAALNLLPGAMQGGFASDGVDYYLPLAHNLTDHGEFAIQQGQPSAKHVPLYPLLLAALDRVGWLGPSSLGITQAILGALVLILIFAWARLLLGTRAGFIATGLAAALADFAAYSYLNMSENLGMVFILAVLLSFERAVSVERLGWWVITGLLLGLSALTREFTITLIIPLGISAFLRVDPRRAISGMAITGFMMLIVISPWTIRNYLVFGELIPLSAKGGLNFYDGTLKGRYHPSDARRNWKIDDPQQKEVERQLKERLAQTDSPSERNRHYVRAAWRNLRNDPYGQVRYAARKAGFFWQANVGWRHRHRLGWPVILALSEGIYWLCLILAVGTALVRPALSEPYRFLWMLIAWIGAFHLVIGEAEPRYHFTALPAIIVLAAESVLFLIYQKDRSGPS